MIELCPICNSQDISRVPADAISLYECESCQNHFRPDEVVRTPENALNKCPECNKGNLIIKQDAIISYVIDEKGKTTEHHEIAQLENIWLECDNCESSTDSDINYSSKLRERFIDLSSLQSDQVERFK